MEEEEEVQEVQEEVLENVQEEVPADEPVDKVELYEMQLKAVVDADTKTYSDLHIAVMKRRYKKIEFLLKHCADTEVHNSYGLTPLHLAASLSDTKSSELLLKYGAEVKPDCCAKFPPLMFAVANKCRPLIQLFLKFGCNIDELVDQSFGYLHYWVRHNDVEMVKFLLDIGANVNNLDCDNASPVCIAIRYTFLDMIELFFSKAVCIHEIPTTCRSPLLKTLYKSPGYTLSILDFIIICDHESMDLLLSAIHRWKMYWYNQNYLESYYVCNENYLQFYLKRRIAGLSSCRKMCYVAEQKIHDILFVLDCSEEIEKMKAEIIYQNISYYDFMVSRKSKLIAHSKHPDVIKVFDGDEYERAFPIYKHMLKWIFIIGKRFIKVRQQLIENMTELFKFDVPLLVSETISDYLSERDLKSVEEALNIG